jgi:hypothetical protein
MCASLCAKLYTKNGQSGMRENPALLEMKKKATADVAVA